jgi:hypothetical protein
MKMPPWTDDISAVTALVKIKDDLQQRRNVYTESSRVVTFLQNIDSYVIRKNKKYSIVNVSVLGS